MRRNWFIVAACAGVALAGFVWLASQSEAQILGGGGGGKKDGEATLPIKQIVLFNSGVGYFQREGDVTGDAKVDLAFSVADVNDLLKSLVLQDLDGGKIGAVSYDSHDPIDKVLRSFAIDLDGNPTLGEIVNQARGEKIELALRGDAKTPTKLLGTIVGVEFKRRPIGKDRNQVVDLETLNIAGPDGLQGIDMEEIVAVRFLNPTLQAEFQRALGILASGHDTGKKKMSLSFNGPGKRGVRVGYVVEQPLWKTTYRLRVDPKGKIFMQGWAIVENTSDDDWNDVRMVLVTGRPISFQMNLYDPLYLPRPIVEPELFASLRPQVHGGAIGGEGPVRGARIRGNPFSSQTLGNVLGAGGLAGVGSGGGLGLGLGGYGGVPGSDPEGPIDGRLTFAELQRRREQLLLARGEAKAKGAAIAGLNFTEGIASVAHAEEVGDYFQYAIDQKISLSRQKSAMLPIIDKSIEGVKVSIFNEETHAKYPLLGLRLKNTSGQPLTQGPITVYDDGSYAGDTRILDLQPNEERLLSYALDQGTEVKADSKSTPSPEMTFRLGEPTLTASYKMRHAKTYTIKNRSTHDRVVIVEHPIQDGLTLVEPKATESTRSHYRFAVKVAAEKTATIEVVEEQARVDALALVDGAVPSYAAAIGVEVKPIVHAHADRLIGLRIEKGNLTSTWKSRETRGYHVRNASEEARAFTIDHVIRKGWSVVGKETAGPETARFRLVVGPNAVGTQVIEEEKVHVGPGAPLKAIDSAKLREYLADPTPSVAVKAALTKTLAYNAQVADLMKRWTEQDYAAAYIGADQVRLRENLKILPQTSDAYKRFLEKFVARETEFEALRTSIRQVRERLEATQREYDAFVANLNAE